jgi:hypothetical protein
VDDSGDICAQLYKKSGGCRARTNHIINQHSALYDVLREFRVYQSMVQGIALPLEPDEDELPGTSKRSKFQIVRDGFVVGTMKQPLPHEQNNFENTLLKLIATLGSSFSLVESDIFRAMCGQLNPLYNIPTTDAL